MRAVKSEFAKVLKHMLRSFRLKVGKQIGILPISGQVTKLKQRKLA